MFSVIVHFKDEKEYHIETPSKYKIFMTVIISAIILFKDITYVVLYPHVNYIATYFMWMSIIAPFAYIYTRKSLGHFEILNTVCIYLGYDWKLAKSNLRSPLQ